MHEIGLPFQLIKFAMGLGKEDTFVTIIGPTRVYMGSCLRLILKAAGDVFLQFIQQIFTGSKLEK